MNGWRFLSTASVVIALGVLGLAFRSQVADAQSPEISELKRAKPCSTTSSMASTGAGSGQVGETKMTVGNDGDWCWFSISGTTGSLFYAPTYRITRAPAHGEVMMGEVNHRARIAYRPAPGFTGEDGFDIANRVTNSERSVTVTVVP
jgi:hypothetical protein